MTGGIHSQKDRLLVFVEAFRNVWETGLSKIADGESES